MGVAACIVVATANSHGGNYVGANTRPSLSATTMAASSFLLHKASNQIGLRGPWLINRYATDKNLFLQPRIGDETIRGVVS